jgi:hypothetical protein
VTEDTAAWNVTKKKVGSFFCFSHQYLDLRSKLVPTSTIVAALHRILTPRGLVLADGSHRDVFQAIRRGDCEADGAGYYCQGRR